ncbi:MAG: hypothetical protein Q9182_004319 [Xanthomendoza sp. 2 TL-2023]
MSSPTSLDGQSSSPRPSHRQSYRSSHSRSRSRSPPPRRRNDDKPKVNTGGFRWKDKSKDTDKHDRPEEQRLERGYREQDRRDRYRDGERDRNGYGRMDEDRDGYKSREGDSRRGGRNDRDYHSRDDARRHDDTSSTPVSYPKPLATTSEPLRKEKKDKKPRIAPTAQPMIIVNVNDRLGTKVAIPCLASDTIGDFKKMVAAQNGRRPHEIMLKRQGERPFKDILTLEDYGISNGVQLDLEVDTGD